MGRLRILSLYQTFGEKHVLDPMRNIVFSLAIILAISGCASQSKGGGFGKGIGQHGEAVNKLAPSVSSSREIIERMLSLAGVQSDDVVYDLGSGDGRIVITAAKKYGARGVGFEIDPRLVKESRDNVRKAGVQDLVVIRQQDILQADLSGATVVTLYLFPEANRLLRPRLWSQLKPGARVVSNYFDMDEWIPDEVEEVLDVQTGFYHNLHLWRITGQPNLVPRDR